MIFRITLLDKGITKIGKTKIMLLYNKKKKVSGYKKGDKLNEYGHGNKLSKLNSYQGGGEMEQVKQKIASFSVEEAKKQLAQLKKAVESGQMTKEQATPIAKLLMARIKKG